MVLNLRKFKVVPFIFLVLLFLMAACSSEEEASGDGVVEIEFAHYDNTGESQEKVERFNELHDDINVKFVNLPATPTEKFSKFSTWFNSESKTPDVLLIDVTWPGMYASAEWIAPIDSYLEEEGEDYLDRFWPVAVETGNVDGKQYGIQGFLDVGLMYYREDLLEEYQLDVPETWNEMIEATKVIREGEGNQDLNGFLYQGAQIEGATLNFLEVLWSVGGDIESEDGTLNIDTPEGVEALTLMRDLIYEDKVSPVSVATSAPNDNANVFGNGDAIFMRNWPFVNQTLKDTNVDGKFASGSLFHKEGEKGHPATGGWMPVINNFSEHKDEAWEFIKFYLSDEEQLSLAVNNSQLPSVKAVYEMDEAIEAQPLLSELTDLLNIAKSRPTLRNYEEFSRILQTEINITLNDGKDPEQAIKDAQKAIDEKINNQ